MSKTSITLHTLEQTERLGELLGTYAQPGDIICLNGDLGAGKTTLAQSIARGLKVPDNEYVSSPSFAVMHEYCGRIPMYHMDFYRLSGSAEVEDMGLDEYFEGAGLCVVEWSVRAADILPAEKLSLDFKLGRDLSREVTITGNLRSKINLSEIFLNP